VPRGDFPEPVIPPSTPSAGLVSSPTATQNYSIEKKKNPANQIARFGAYPSRRSLLAVSVQKFPVIVIINQARIGI
jgi:hypothetical protein